MLILIFKSLHIISIVAWIASLFYILSLFIYQTKALEKDDTDKSLLIGQYKQMAKKIWLPVGWISAILVLIFGAGMMHPYLSQGWFQLKLLLVLLLYIFHYWVHFTFREMQKDNYKYSVYHIGLMIDVFIVLLVAIVFLAVLKTNINYSFLAGGSAISLLVLFARTWYVKGKVKGQVFEN